ncbi:hypothetical protein OZX73_02200 [Bifidobacterium sp. ESL0775]|uniref:hypothetical protein n=1 Tax=Bifidobacterium sp. ESL0775 TaxID=2983230 RepID=UPI0023F942E5|nr:hypothetical protein [Bifidobacterium sp. ESL0775]WEV69714.1 hypothetical protein OZX73_02200 [Bifidobacterium sp. ESL0775]
MMTLKAAELDRIFDKGDESILDYADMSTLRKLNKDENKQEDVEPANHRMIC